MLDYIYILSTRGTDNTGLVQWESRRCESYPEQDCNGISSFQMQWPWRQELVTISFTKTADRV
jgi:hypothetical protein